MGKYYHRQLLCRFSNNSDEVQGPHLLASVPRTLPSPHRLPLFGEEVKAHEQHCVMRTEGITSESPGMIFSKECGKDNFPLLPNSSECTTEDEDFQRLTAAQRKIKETKRKHQCQ